MEVLTISTEELSMSIEVLTISMEALSMSMEVLAISTISMDWFGGTYKHY